MKTRREFICQAVIAAGGARIPALLAQDRGDRPSAAPDGAAILNPRARVPVSLIIDDSTCLVNLNRFAMPQFDRTYAGKNAAYHQPWRDWPHEIPDRFVRKFAEWAAANGVKGKYSVVPYPACVGRLDRELPGWSAGEVRDSIKLVREAVMPNFDIHPEMVTHTRVIDVKTGHPYPEVSTKFMENWDWTTGRSADEIGEYMAYGLNILKNVDLPCSGVTTPGGFGNKARPQLAKASLNAIREVFGSEVPHYFRDMYSSGDRSVAPRVELASGLDGADPRCVVSIVGCAGDWTGGWDCTLPGGADQFITSDGKSGRMVEVIERGEPAIIVVHWTGIYFNGQELGLQILDEVVKRLHARFDHLAWMTLSEISRYWAAKELSLVERDGDVIRVRAPFECPDFTLRVKSDGVPRFVAEGSEIELTDAGHSRKLKSGSWCREGADTLICVHLKKGNSSFRL